MPLSIHLKMVKIVNFMFYIYFTTIQKKNYSTALGSSQDGILKHVQATKGRYKKEKPRNKKQRKQKKQKIKCKI